MRGYLSDGGGVEEEEEAPPPSDEEEEGEGEGQERELEGLGEGEAGQQPSPTPGSSSSNSSSKGRLTPLEDIAVKARLSRVVVFSGSSLAQSVGARGWWRPQEFWARSVGEEGPLLGGREGWMVRATNANELSV
jgi:hypothetical protein